MVKLYWERIEESGSRGSCQRCKVPGGWLMKAWSFQGNSGLTFVPDPNHSWN